LDQRPDVVQRRSRVEVGLKHPLRVRRAPGGSGSELVYQIATVDRERDAINLLAGGAAWLRVLRALHLGHPLDAAQAGCRHDARDHRLVDAETPEALDEIEVVGRVEE